MTDIYAKLLQDIDVLEFEKTTGYIFSADDLRNVSDWSSQVIEDYLAKTRNLAVAGQVSQDVIDAIFDLRTRGEALEDQVSWLTPISVVTDTDFTTSGNQFIYCANLRPNEITVTLNGNPRDTERVWITQGGYHVVISGNGRTINGDNTIKMNRQNQTRAIEYNLQLDNWVIV
jgi:hypothetical protein